MAFKRLNNGSTVEGMGEDGEGGGAMVHPVTLPLPPLVGRTMPPIVLMVPPPPR